MDFCRRLLVALSGLLLVGFAVCVLIGMINPTLAAVLLQDASDFLAILSASAGSRIWQYLLFAVGFLVLGVILLIIACFRKKTVRQVRVTAEDGTTVDVSLDAVSSIIRHAVKRVTQVSDTNLKLSVKNNALSIGLNIIVAQGESIPGIGTLVRQAVAKDVQALTGIVAQDIWVKISNVQDEVRREV